MVCSACKVEAMIYASHTEVTNDDTPDKQTEVYAVQDFVCRNSKCPQYMKKIGEQKIRIYPVEGGETDEVRGENL